MSRDLEDVIKILAERRDGHVASADAHRRQAEQDMASADLLEQAIANLTQLDFPEPVHPRPAEPIHETTRAEVAEGRSVYETVLAFAAEGPREWSAEDVVKEAERRGTPLTVKDPMNAVFSALSRANRKGDLVRTGHGTYRHSDFVTQWTANEDGSSPHEISFTIHPADTEEVDLTE